MPLDLSQAFEACRRGSSLFAADEFDGPEFDILAEWLNNRFESEDEAGLLALETQLRSEAPESLPWYMMYARMLAGTVASDTHLCHLVYVPLLSKGASVSEISLGQARHEIEGSLEEALDLGHGSLHFLPRVVPFESLERTSLLQWRHAAEGRKNFDEALPGGQLDAQGGALVGRWVVKKTDRARLSRKLLHAMQRTAQLISCHKRMEGLLAERAGGEAIQVYPILQLQDFFSGFRQIQFVRDLENACLQMPNAQSLKWAWVDEAVVCSLGTEDGQLIQVRARFPDEPRQMAIGRMQGFCARRGLQLVS